MIITLRRGDTKAFSITVRENGVPVDITGWTIFFTAKVVVDDDATDAAAVIKKKVTAHVDAANGLSAIEFEPSDTSSLVPREYQHDFQFVTATGKVYTPDDLAGTTIITPDIGRRIT